MNELTLIGREPNPDRERATGRADQPQKPRVIFPFKVAFVAAFCTLLMKLLP